MNDRLTVGSLFAGIGGFDLGLERAGMRTAWQVEIDPFCRNVLARWFPDALRFDDVCSVGAGNLTAVDVVCGGFPCQDISFAGTGAGLAGARSGLWGQFARIVGELRPRYVIVENVPALASRGLDRVLADLAACGFDAEWDHLPARAFGAPHRRDRLWLVAYADGDGLQGRERPGPPAGVGRRPAHPGDAANVADAESERRRPSQPGRPARARQAATEHASPGRAVGGTGDGAAHWRLEPDVGRVADGIPHRVDRLRALGNALVPQVAEWIGRQIIAWEAVSR